MKRVIITLFILAAVLVLLRLNVQLLRPAYASGAIVTNPAGTCALVEYQFKGWADPYAWFAMADGDAFYLVKEIGTGRVMRDSTASIPAIPAISVGLAGMGDSVFYWSRDGSAAAFPGGAGPYHEWAGIEECAGARRHSDFSSLACNTDILTPNCASLRKQLSP